MKKTTLILTAIIILAAVLRLFALDRFPWGLNADEAAIGYNAYSLIETGRDEHGASWPLSFRSFDDFKPPVYFYLVLPFVKLLGLSIWAVRLPSALLGIATVYLAYLLSKELFSGRGSDQGRRSDPERKPLGGWAHDAISGGSDLIGLTSAFLLAISPWHLHYSRGGWEVNAGLFFLTLGLWAFFKGLKKHWLLILSTMSFVVSMYTYHSLRVVSPLIILYLLLTHKDKIFRNLKLGLRDYLDISNSKLGIYVIACVIFAIASLLPLGYQFIGSSGGSARFAGVSIFADPGPLNYVLEMRRTSPDPDSLITKIRYNRYTAYAYDFASNLVSHYSPVFLFVSGDEIARNKVPNMGQSYLWTLPFVIIGLYSLSRRLNKKTLLIPVWLLVGVIPSALTFQSPHALRSENIVVPLMIVIALGIASAFDWVLKLKIKNLKFISSALISVFVVVVIINFGYYLNRYYVAYPQTYGYAWQPGFDKLADYLKDNSHRYDQVIISTRYDQPYILVAFFLKVPPSQFQKELVFSTPDRFGFSTGLEFDKYRFHPIDWAVDSLLPNALIVVADEPVGESAHLVKTIPFPNGESVFRLYATSPASDVKLLAR